MVGAGCEPELRGERFGLFLLEPGGLEVAGGGEGVEGGGKQGGAPVDVRGTAYPRGVTWRYPFPAVQRRRVGRPGIPSFPAVPATFASCALRGFLAIPFGSCGCAGEPDAIHG